MSSESIANILPTTDERPGIIYQKDASISAILDVRPNVTERNKNKSANTVRFIATGNFKSNSSSPSVIHIPTERKRVNNKSLCLKNCGSGKCSVEVNDVDNAVSSSRCHCVLGKTGSNCQTGRFKNSIIY